MSHPDPHHIHAGPPVERLTPQESRIVALLADGLTCKDVAVSMNLAYKTIVAHVHNAQARTHTHSCANLVAWAFRHGVLDANPVGFRVAENESRLHAVAELVDQMEAVLRSPYRRVLTSAAGN